MVADYKMSAKGRTPLCAIPRLVLEVLGIRIPQPQLVWYGMVLIMTNPYELNCMSTSCIVLYVMSSSLRAKDEKKLEALYQGLTTFSMPYWV